MNKDELDRSLELLIDLGVIKRSTNNLHYSAAIDGPGSRDFLGVNMQKKVKVSPEGHRSVRLRGLLMALKDGIAERRCGSFVWRDEMPSPKYTLLRPKRSDPLNGKDLGVAVFDVEKRAKNDLVFKLRFDPPLTPGQIVTYGFYVWNKNHFSRTRKEAIERYRDEWIREGLAILDPTIKFGLTIELPDEYEYGKAIAEKDPVLTMGGPNVPGSEVHRFEKSQRFLSYMVDEPPVGHYFVSWIPPV